MYKLLLHNKGCQKCLKESRVLFHGTVNFNNREPPKKEEFDLQFFLCVSLLLIRSTAPLIYLIIKLNKKLILG